jgi:hypothetical protein
MTENKERSVSRRDSFAEPSEWRPFLRAAVPTGRPAKRPETKPRVVDIKS